jgi:phosphatidylserine decarboxylase
MSDIKIFDRETKKIEKEKILGRGIIIFLSKDNIFSKFFIFIIRFPIFSKLFAFFQKTRFSKSKIKKFVKKYDIDTSEMVKKTNEFKSFNDFFIREIKKRKINLDKKNAIIPADGRYLAYQNIGLQDNFFIKGSKYDLSEFLQDKKLSQKYDNGTLVIGRLNPTDYHRFHFPFDCIAKKAKLINGSLMSVNPLILMKNPQIFCQNKRMITILESKFFGNVIYVEIGATFVGAIHQTYSPNKEYKKGQEKGYFSFGGSSIVMLFEKDKIKIDDDILENSQKEIEVKGKFSQSLGTC